LRLLSDDYSEDVRFTTIASTSYINGSYMLIEHHERDLASRPPDDGGEYQDVEQRPDY
jgi:hypothetical protein